MRLDWSDDDVYGGATSAVYRPGRWPRVGEIALSAAGGVVTFAAAVLVWRFATPPVITRLEGSFGTASIQIFNREFRLAALSFVAVRIFVLIGLVTALMNLTPRAPGLDGFAVLLAARGGPAFRHFDALLRTEELLLAGTRWRDLPDDLLDDLADPDTHRAFRADGYQIRYHAALDRGDLALAGKLLDGTIATAYGIPRVVALEIAYFEARHRDNPELARLWQERMRRAKEPSHWWWRAEAAIALAEGRAEDATAAAEAGLAAVERYEAEEDPHEPRAVMEADQLRAMLVEAMAAAPTVSLSPTSGEAQRQQ